VLCCSSKQTPEETIEKFPIFIDKSKILSAPTESRKRHFWINYRQTRFLRRSRPKTTAYGTNLANSDRELRSKTTPNLLLKAIVF